MKRYFENLPIDVVYSIPLSRAVETAETVFPRHKPFMENWKFHLDNASVSLLYHDERRFTLVKLNDTHHLKDIVVEWY